MKFKKIFVWLLLLLIVWITFDLLISPKHSLRHFDPVAVGQLDAGMWRSYYERRRGRLFLQLSKLMREQFHAPFWRSYIMAYQAAKAATVFQDGRNRDEYAHALPFLEKYFSQINALSEESFEVKVVAKNELEWWIIRREPEHTSADWEQVLAEVSAAMYHEPVEKFAGYARLRVEAMLLRDSLGTAITEPDWLEISRLCRESWRSLHNSVND